MFVFRISKNNDISILAKDNEVKIVVFKIVLSLSSIRLRIIK